MVVSCKPWFRAHMWNIYSMYVYTHSHNKTILWTCRESLSNCGDKYEIFLFSIFRFKHWYSFVYMQSLHCADVGTNIFLMVHPLITIWRRWWKCLSLDFRVQSSIFPSFNASRAKSISFYFIIYSFINNNDDAKEHSFGLETLLAQTESNGNFRDKIIQCSM